jgi:UDP-sugar transporter A1/2/3
MRYSRLVAGKLYISTTAVVLSEFSKMIICLLIILYQEKSVVKWLAHLYEGLVINWKDTLKMSIPAIVYMIQNNLQYVAVSNLEPAVFQVNQ